MPAQRIEDREGMGPRIARIQHMGTRAKHIKDSSPVFLSPLPTYGEVKLAGGSGGGREEEGAK